MQTVCQVPEMPFWGSAGPLVWHQCKHLARLPDVHRAASWEGQWDSAFSPFLSGSVQGSPGWGHSLREGLSQEGSQVVASVTGPAQLQPQLSLLLSPAASPSGPQSSHLGTSNCPHVSPVRSHCFPPFWSFLPGGPGGGRRLEEPGAARMRPGRKSG